MTFLWPWPQVMAVALINKNMLFWYLYTPSHAFYLITFWRNSVGNFFGKYSLTLDFPRWSFEIGIISGIVGLIGVKWQGSELIRYWADCMTSPFDHTCDIDLEVSRSVFEIALSQEWDSWLTWNKMDMSRPFMNMILSALNLALAPRLAGFPLTSTVSENMHVLF